MFTCLLVFCHLMTNMTWLSWIDKNYMCTTRSSPLANQFHTEMNACFAFTWYCHKIWVLVLRLHDMVAKFAQSEFSLWYNNQGDLMLVCLTLMWHFVVVSCKQIRTCIIKGFLQCCGSDCVVFVFSPVEQSLEAIWWNIKHYIHWFAKECIVIHSSCFPELHFLEQSTASKWAIEMLSMFNFT